MLTRAQWVAKYYPDAYQVTQGTGIFPETLLAIAIVESQGKGPDGNYYPGAGLVARRANNYFGVKAYPKWRGQTILLPTPGDADKLSRFCVYPSIKESFRGFVYFLQNNKRYKEKGVFNSQNYAEQIARIAAAGYSESGAYRDVITSIANRIKEYSKDVQKAANNTGEIFPLLFAAAVVAFVALTNNAKK